MALIPGQTLQLPETRGGADYRLDNCPRLSRGFIASLHWTITGVLRVQLKPTVCYSEPCKQQLNNLLFIHLINHNLNICDSIVKGIRKQPNGGS